MSERNRAMIDYIVACVNDFSERHAIPMVLGFDYLRQRGGIDFLERNYDIEHTYEAIAKPRLKRVGARVPRARCLWIVRSRGTRDPTGRGFAIASYSIEEALEGLTTVCRRNGGTF